MTASARRVSGSSHDRQRACRPRVRNAPTSPASSPSPSTRAGQPARTRRGWKTSGRASFMGGDDSCMHAIEVAEHGGPEVLQYVEKSDPSPGPGEVLIKAEAIGVNYIDTYFRSATYPREVPFILGQEVCGTIAAVGDDVAALSVGDRVVTVGAKGAYAQYSVAPADF